MKAILINTTSKTITEVEVSKKNTLNDWYKHLGVDIVEIAVSIGRRNQLLVDEEGLLRSGPKYFFTYGSSNPFAGNGLIVGTDSKGDSVDTTITLEEVKRQINFLDN